MSVRGETALLVLVVPDAPLWAAAVAMLDGVKLVPGAVVAAGLVVTAFMKALLRLPLPCPVRPETAGWLALRG